MATTRKKAASKKAVAKPGAGTSMATMQEQMAAKIAEMNDSASSAGASQALKLKSETTVEVPNLGDSNAPLEVILLDFVTRREYYDPKIPFDRDNPSPPICFAVGVGKSENRVILLLDIGRILGKGASEAAAAAASAAERA